MSRPLKVQIVESARALIADEENWCRGELARDARGMGVCPMSDSAIKRYSLGALIMAAYQITNDRRQAHDLAIKAMRPLHGAPRLLTSGSRFSCSVIGAHFCSGRTRLPNSGLSTLQGHRFGRQSSLSWVSLGTAIETTEIGGCCRCSKTGWKRSRTKEGLCRCSRHRLSSLYALG